MTPSKKTRSSPPIPMFKANVKHVSVRVNDVEMKEELMKTIVIVGVERGGTSMVAGVLRALGVHLGDKVGRNHEDHNFQSEDESTLLKHIKENNKKHKVWGFKFPKASLKLDFYNQELRNPHYIVVFRNISSVVDSWCSRGSVDPCQTALHAIHYYQNIVESVQASERPALFISYERGCDSIDEMIDDLVRFCGIYASEHMIVEARSIVTGDGGGYVNLPDRYFHVKELDNTLLGSKEIPLRVQSQGDFVNVAKSRTVTDYDIIDPLVSPLPKRIYLVFYITVDDKSILERNKIRLFMNYDDHYFIGHAYCPNLCVGRNVLKIEHYGELKGLAFAGIKDGVDFSISKVTIFENMLDASSGKLTSRIYRLLRNRLK